MVNSPFSFVKTRCTCKFKPCKKTQPQKLKTFGDMLSCRVTGQNVNVSRNICHKGSRPESDNKQVPNKAIADSKHWKPSCPIVNTFVKGRPVGTGRPSAIRVLLSSSVK